MNDAKNKECLLEVVDVHKVYNSKTEPLEVLSGTSIKVFSGEILAIVGASGAGKSTLLHVMGGLDRPTSGQVLFHGKDIFQEKNSFLETFRNLHVGFVFQTFNLLSDFSALENTMFPALIKNTPKQKARERAEDLLCKVGLKERIHHRPGELSGGESQRAALARALMNQPELLLADEPTGNLDTRSSDDLMALIRQLNEEFNQTFVIVTHSQRIAGNVDKVYELVDGVVDPREKKSII